MIRVRYNNSVIEVLGEYNRSSSQVRQEQQGTYLSSSPQFPYNLMKSSSPSYSQPKPLKTECKVDCVNVISKATENCPNTPVTIAALGTGAVIKAPVVLAELTVQINMDYTIELPEFAYDIEEMKKRVKVTQCVLLQDTNILFLKGFVLKSIDYIGGVGYSREGTYDDIRHCTADIPFSCTTPVTFNGIEPISPVSSSTAEYEYFRKEDIIISTDSREKDQHLRGEMREYNNTTIEYLNEMPYCELEKSKIVEFDKELHPVYPDLPEVPVGEKMFNRIEQKMAVFITLKLLQNRHVAIPTVSDISD